jgi:hypothetical protein
MANPEDRVLIANGIEALIQFVQKFTKQGRREQAESCAIIPPETSLKQDPDPSKVEEMPR